MSRRFSGYGIGRRRLAYADELFFGPQQKKQPKIPPDPLFLPPIFSLASATACENPSLSLSRSLEELIWGMSFTLLLSRSLFSALLFLAVFSRSRTGEAITLN